MRRQKHCLWHTVYRNGMQWHRKTLRAQMLWHVLQTQGMWMHCKISEHNCYVTVCEYTQGNNWNQTDNWGKMLLHQDSTSTLTQKRIERYKPYESLLKKPATKEMSWHTNIWWLVVNGTVCKYTLTDLNTRADEWRHRHTCRWVLSVIDIAKAVTSGCKYAESRAHTGMPDRAWAVLLHAKLLSVGVRHSVSELVLKQSCFMPNCRVFV